MRRALFKPITTSGVENAENFIWYKSVIDFNVPVNVFDPSRINTPGITLNAGDIFGMASMEFQITSDLFENSDVLLIRGELQPVLCSRDFLDLNGLFFKDITDIHLRNLKLDELLK